jgi:Holliday junction resolvase
MFGPKANDMSKYVKGRRFEYRVRDLFEGKGYVVIRAAQSKPIDLVCLRNGEILLVECKTEKSPLTRAKREELLDLARISGGSAILAQRKKRKIELVRI